MAYLTKTELESRIGIEALVSMTIGGFPNRLAADEFDQAVLAPIMNADDKAFVDGLYDTDDDQRALRSLSDAETSRYFSIHCAAHGVTRIESALADTDAEIDGFLQGRYTTPVSPAPEALKKYAADLAVYNLLGFRRLDEEKDKDFVRRAEAARSWLGKVAEGKYSLGIKTQGEEGTEAPRGGAKIRSRPRLDWRGY